MVAEMSENRGEINKQCVASILMVSKHNSKAVRRSENLGVPVVMWGYNLPPGLDRVN